MRERSLRNAAEGFAQRMNMRRLDAVTQHLPQERRDIVDSLKEQSWFQNTDPKLQRRLATLPHSGKENHDGFLTDLAKRPDEVGGVTVQKMVDLPAGNFALIPKFEVKNEKGDTYPYEYVSWRYGPDSGAKGLVFVKGEDGAYSHFILLRGDKFATGKTEFDSIGGFADLNTGDPADSQVTNMLGRIKEEITEELGVPEIKVDEVYDLGSMNTDAGMTNNNPDLFAAVIDGSEATKILTDVDINNPDARELRSGALIIPMSQLPEVVKNNNDSFFLASVSRALAHGVITWPELDETPVPYHSSDQNLHELAA